MGDLRNKIAKIEGVKRDKAAMEAFLRAGGWKPQVPAEPQPIIRCQCGLTYYETTIWAVQEDRRKPAQFYCAVCLP